MMSLALVCLLYRKEHPTCTLSQISVFAHSVWLNIWSDLHILFCGMSSCWWPCQKGTKVILSENAVLKSKEAWRQKVAAVSLVGCYQKEPSLEICFKAQNILSGKFDLPIRVRHDITARTWGLTIPHGTGQFLLQQPPPLSCTDARRLMSLNYILPFMQGRILVKCTITTKVEQA